MPKLPRKLKWKKVGTREYTFLYTSYAADVYKIMEKEVGTTLQYNLFYGEGKLLTIYRIERDIQNSYKMIERIAQKDPEEITKKMDTFDALVKKDYELFTAIKKNKNKKEIRTLLLKLDKTFLQTLCYYLFFVYLGYAGNLPAIAKFLKKNGKRFGRIRTYTIDTDMNKEYPALFGRYNRRLKLFTSYMTRREFIETLDGRRLDLKKIQERKTKYLIIMKKLKIKEYPFHRINNILDTELAHIRADLNLSLIKGQIVCSGRVVGKARVIFTSQDYKKIKKGDIVITPMTKPTIVPFLSTVKGIVTNDGGALSHASIISREMNIPCVVGTVYATDIFKNGDLVEVDAYKGIVRKIK